MYWICGIFLVTAGIVSADDSATVANITNPTARDGKALSVFQVVRFPNIVCSGTSSYNGTCYTSSECTNKGGTAAGSCASGFGVCCTFTLGCGAKISENNTYFVSSTSPGAGQCGVTICKCSTDICSIRLDFSTFVITGPTTVTLSTVYTSAGSVTIFTKGALGSISTQCLTDTFSVTGNGNQVPPAICGTNSGYHMYVDASNSCNMLNFQLGTNAMGTTLATRSWNIRISQISCYDPNLPPQGCTQYNWGTTATGIIYSYNYANTQQLAYQKQVICTRRERGYCKICYSEATTKDFAVSGLNTAGLIGSFCCNYGKTASVTVTKPWDCVIIPGAKTTAGVMLQNNICGGLFAKVAGTTSATICSIQQPYMLTFQTDGFTSAVAIVAMKGFKLVYWQSTTCV